MCNYTGSIKLGNKSGKKSLMSHVHNYITYNNMVLAVARYSISYYMVGITILI